MMSTRYFTLHIFSFFFLGWGKIQHPGSSHNILQQAEIPPVTNSVCQKKLDASQGLP